MRIKIQNNLTALLLVLTASISVMTLVSAGIEFLFVTSAQAEPAVKVIYRYEVRGKIVAIPEADGSKKREIRIKHEAINDFVDDSGMKVGMGGMTMSFPLADGVSLQGLSVGDDVKFVFESWWKPSPGDHISSIQKISSTQRAE